MGPRACSKKRKTVLCRNSEGARRPDFQWTVHGYWQNKNQRFMFLISLTIGHLYHSEKVEGYLVYCQLSVLEEVWVLSTGISRGVAMVIK